MKWSHINNVNYKRTGHSANVIGDSIYLFGGRNKNDIQKYNIKEKTLSEIKTKGNIPGGRTNHGSAVIKDNLYIFGGKGRSKTDNTLYCFNTNSTEWIDIPIIQGSPPQPRRLMSMFSFENKLYVFGGYNNNSPNNGYLYGFSLNTSCWS